jgi:sporulation protein YlmC with PRC-barrel domain
MIMNNRLRSLITVSSAVMAWSSLTNAAQSPSFSNQLSNLITHPQGTAPSQPTQPTAQQPVPQHPTGQRIGMLEEAKKALGSSLMNAQSKPIGKVDDFVVDLESGRILYVIANLTGNNQQIALPATSLKEHHSGKGHVVLGDQSKLSGAPQVAAGQTNDPGNVGFVSQVYQYFGVPAWWAGQGNQTAGSFNNAHKASTLFGQSVKDVSNADFGKVDDLILDVNAGRVPFVVLNRQNAYYAVPPNAFTLAPDKTTLVTGLNQSTLSSAPRYTKGNVQMLANATTANAIYQHYGKQPYFGSGQGLSPTSDTNASRVYPVPPK